MIVQRKCLRTSSLVIQGRSKAKITALMRWLRFANAYCPEVIAKQSHVESAFAGKFTNRWEGNAGAEKGKEVIEQSEEASWAKCV